MAEVKAQVHEDSLGEVDHFSFGSVKLPQTFQGFNIHRPICGNIDATGVVHELNLREFRVIVYRA